MKNINIKTIRIDGGTQSRVEINNEIVTEYAEAIKGGAEFPPVVIFNDGVDNWLADGFHRFHAHNQAGKTSIQVEIRQGTARDAILFSLGANGSHGLRPSNADKRKAVMTLLNDFDWSAFSNSEMAKICNVSQRYVNQIKASLTMNVHSEKPKEVTFKTKHGTVATMQTANIGKKKPWEQADPNAHSGISAEELAEHGLTEEDMHEEVESDEVTISRLGKEKMELLDRLEAVLCDDLAKKVNDQQTEIYGLRGHIQQLMASEKSMESKLKYTADIIHKLRKIYSVETHAEIIAAAQAQVA